VNTRVLSLFKIHPAGNLPGTPMHSLVGLPNALTPSKVETNFFHDEL